MQPNILQKLSISCFAAALVLSNTYADKANAIDFEDDFSEFSLDELMNVEVTSVSLTSQSVMESAAAIHVVTAADIKHRGLRSLPEALRQIPGLEVAAIGAADYAITSRGSNEAFSNKLLVLIDGRSVYTPLFSGVYWDVQTLPVELIDRIEVIRGPGGSIWGSNAVNGIINVITKPAAGTEGLDARAGGGTLDHGYGYAALGGAIGDNTHYRLTGKWQSRDGVAGDTDARVHKQQRVYHAGVRFDHVLDARSKLTFDGNLGVSSSKYESLFISPAEVALSLQPSLETSVSDKLNLSLRSKWTRALDDRGELFVQAYYDYAELSTQEQRSTFDLSLHHSFFMNAKHQITWGGQVRVADSRYEASPGLDFGADRADLYASLFVQDQFELKQDRLKLVTGLKLEHTPFQDMEIQPSVRMAYTPNTRTTIWGGISRAVRVPSHAENQAAIFIDVIPAGTPGVNPGPFPLMLTGEGTNDFESEELVAFEVGFRRQMTDEVFLDATAFYNRHDNLRVTKLGTLRTEFVSGAPVLVLPLHAGNEGEADSFGVEATLTWAPSERSQFNFLFSYLNMDTSVDGPAGSFLEFSTIEGLSPDFQIGLEWRQKLGRSVNLNVRTKYVDALNADIAPDRLELDVTMSWEVNDQLTVDITGENLAYGSRRQFTTALSNQYLGGKIPRSVFAALRVSF